MSALAERVTLRLDPELDACFPARTLARVKVTCAGRSFTSDVTSPSGDATNALTWAELEAKFHSATKWVASEAQRGEVLDAVDALACGDGASLMACLGTPTLERRAR